MKTNRVGSGKQRNESQKVISSTRLDRLRDRSLKVASLLSYFELDDYPNKCRHLQESEEILCIIFIFLNSVVFLFKISKFKSGLISQKLHVR